MSFMDNKDGKFCEYRDYVKLEAENARLKALTVEMDKTINASQAECRRLRAEVERLTKAGDDMALNLTHIGWNICVEAWKAAKEGKQS
jgi:hypothetical protein